MANDAGVWVKLEDAGSSAPGAAVIDSATHKDPADDTVKPIVATSFVGDGTNGDLNQAYDVYEFLGSGTLNVSEPGMVDALIIGGGGSGGRGNNANTGAGGGGAGARLQTSVYLSDDAVPVIIGAGGAGVSNMNDNTGISGETSNLGLTYSPGGGGGISYLSDAGGRGGSGGGAGSLGNTWVINGGTGISGLGNNGGNGFGTTSGNAMSGGGGGGASSNGADGQSNVAGNGGNGVDDSGFIGATPGSLVVAGGGGGSTPVSGTQGTGGSNVGGNGGGSPTDGEQNTGAGGGAGNAVVSGQGGSGIVIVRVKVPTTSFAARSSVTKPKTAHAARIENGVVRQVITIPHLDDDDNKITEYCNKIGLPGTWVDTSYTGARRGKYAGVGDLFDPRQKNAEFTSPVEEME